MSAFSTSTCSGAPDVAYITTDSSSCIAATCTSISPFPGTLGYSAVCSNASVSSTISSTFGSSQFFAFESYSDSSCATLVAAYAIKANTCLTTSSAASSKVVVNSDGSVSMSTHTAASCAGSPTSVTLPKSGTSSTGCSDISSTGLATGLTYGRYYTGITTGSVKSASTSLNSASAFYGAVLAAAICVLAM